MNIDDRFAVLQPDLRVETVAVTPTLYQDLDARFAGFGGHVLISSHAFDSDWGVWERHPAGDEIVVLLSGRARFTLREPGRQRSGGEQSVLLDCAGDYVVVPAGAWHTAHIEEPARMLFITPGEGTENREQP